MKFFLLLQKASQKGIDMDAKVLQNGYDEFVLSVFQDKVAFIDKDEYHNALAYTRVELASLPEVSGKKCNCLSM